MKPEIVVGSLLICAGVYAASHAYFFPEKISPKMPRRVYYILCAMMVLGGSLVAIGIL